MAKNDLNRLKVVLVEQHKTAKWLAEQMEKDPRTYTNMPPCMMNTITPAGLPMKKSKPLNLFE